MLAQRKQAWGAPVVPDAEAAESPARRVQSGEGTPAKVLSKLQSEVYRRRMRVKDTFEGFDPLNSGRCTSSQFQRAINRLSPNVSPEDGKTLADYFTDQDRPGPQVVNYKQFSRTVEEVFTPLISSRLPRPGAAEHGQPQAAERQPQGGGGGPDGEPAVEEDARVAQQGVPMSARYERDFRRGDHLLPSARRSLASAGAGDAAGGDGLQVVQKLRGIVRRRSLRVHGAFQDFDPLRRGVCSPTHLRTVLTVLNIALQPAEVDALLRLYRVHGWDRSDFDYRRFCNDVNELSLYGCAGTPAGGPPPGDSRGGPDDPGRPVSRGLAMQDMTNILAKLCKQLRDWRRDMKDAFSEAFRQFDPRHRGVITPQQFGRIISMQGFSVTEAELKSLCQAFTDTREGGPLFRCQGFLDALGTCMAIHFSSDDRPPSVRPGTTAVAKLPASKDAAADARRQSVLGAGCVSTEAVAAPYASSINIAYPPTRCKSTAAYGAARRRLQASK